MEKFKFSRLQKIIVCTAFLPIALLPIYMIFAYIGTGSNFDGAFAVIILPMMASMLISLAINTLLLPISITQTIFVFRKTNSYHKWLLLVSTFVGPILMFYFISGALSATYM